MMPHSNSENGLLVSLGTSKARRCSLLICLSCVELDLAVMSAKVDADHAADTVTRRSRTGFFVYLNCAMIYWSSKKHKRVSSQAVSGANSVR